jgi:hypothetical protein
VYVIIYQPSRKFWRREKKISEGENAYFLTRLGSSVAGVWRAMTYWCLWHYSKERQQKAWKARCGRKQDNRGAPVRVQKAASSYKWHLGPFSMSHERTSV